jgi:hypothetical protein
MAIDIEKIWASDKVLAIEPDWKGRENNEFVRLVSPIDISGVTIAGLSFTASAHIYTPDRGVTFQVEYIPPKRELECPH